MHIAAVDARRLVARALVIVLLPAPPVLFLTTRSLGLAAAALVLFLVTFVVAVGWLFPRYPRIDALLEVLPTLFTTGIAPLAGLAFTIMDLCGSGDDGVSYLGTRGALIAAGALGASYAGGSSWALARPARFVWAWPLAVCIAIGVGVVALAVVEGGPHACST